jgi:Mn-dependent DtxR family transcriptional regulator
VSEGTFKSALKELELQGIIIKIQEGGYKLNEQA